MSVAIRAATVERRTQAGKKAPREETAARPDLPIKRRRPELDGHLVVEVRARPLWPRCALAPHAAEVLIFRPESRYHRLVFTVSEWETFLAEVKTGLYDVASAS